MLDNKFFLTSVAKFLRRGRVDRGTGGGKVVVVVDSSKRKVRSGVHLPSSKDDIRRLGVRQPHPYLPLPFRLLSGRLSMNYDPGGSSLVTS